MVRTLAAFFALAILLPQMALAQPPTDCSTPRNAVGSVFRWLQPDSYATGMAARCLDPFDRTPEERERLAPRIKELFDARALYVAMERLPDQADFIDARTGQARVVVDRRLPEVWVERQADGQWRWPAEVLDTIETLHAETSGGLVEALIRKMPESMRGKVFGVELWQYLALLLVAMFGLVLRKVIQVAVASRIHRLAERFGQVWATKMIAALDSPGATLVMAGVLAVAYPQLQLPIKAALAMEVAVRLIAAIALVWAAYRLVDVASAALAHRASLTESKLDDQLVPLVRRSAKVATVILGALFVLQNLDVDVGSLLAGLGIGGLAFALAAKDTLANFFGSVVIFADRPFQIGDWVLLADGTEGIVEEVGFRSTRIRTFYNSLVTVPNAKVADAKVDNYGARRYRRTYTTVHLSRDTTPEQIQAFVEGVRAIIRANAYARKDYYEIHLSGIGEWSYQVMLYFFFEVKSWTEELRERHNVYLEILRLARTIGVDFAFPTSHMRHDYVAEPGMPRQVPEAPPVDDLAAAIHAFTPGSPTARPGGNEIAGGIYANQEIPPPPAKKSA